MNVVLVLALLFCSSFILTRLVCFLAIKKGWFDIPGSRSSHSQPTPRSGGIAFIVTFLGALVYIYSTGALFENELFALLAGLIVAVLGFFDDLMNLSIKLRISVHFIVVLLALFFLGGPPEISIFSFSVNFQEGGPLLLGYILAAWALVWLINLYNFMDGIDGLAGLEAVFISLAAGSIVLIKGNSTIAFLLFSLGVVVSGFLPLNLPKAKIFMGDTGSNFLGFIIGVLSLITINRGLMDVWTWAILLGVFIVDATMTLIGRMRSNEVWYHAHRSHAYQQAAIKYARHGKVDLGVSLINCFWLFPLAWLNVWIENYGLAFVLLAYMPIFFLGRYYRHNRDFE